MVRRFKELEFVLTAVRARFLTLLNRTLCVARCKLLTNFSRENQGLVQKKKKKIPETVAGAIESCRSVFVLIFVKLLLQFLDYTAASYIRSVVKRYWLSAWIVQLVPDY